MRENFR